MKHSNQRGTSRYLASNQRALDRMDEHLNFISPEVEREKIEQVVLLLFGADPDGFEPGPLSLELAPDTEPVEGLSAI